MPKASFLQTYIRKLFSSSLSPATMSAAKTKAQQIIDDNSVAVFSKSYCPYCKATKSLLAEMGAKPFIMELDQVDDGTDIQAALKEMSGQSTVPNVYIGQKHIGGNSDVQAKKSELPTLLKEANAI